MSFYQNKCTMGKRNYRHTSRVLNIDLHSAYNQTLLRVMDIGSDINFRTPKTSLWSTSQSRSLWRSDEMVNGVSAPVHVIMGPLGTYFLSSGFAVGIDIFSSWQNHYSSFTCAVRAIKMWKAKWRPFELPLTRKIVNQKQYHISGDIVEISATIKDTKEAGVVILTTSHFSLPIWPMQKRDGLWRRTMSFLKLNQVVTTIVTVVPDVVTLLNQIWAN